MKRSPLKRKTGLRRTALQRAIGAIEVPRPKSKTKHARRERAPASWFVWVKSQSCFVSVLVQLGAIDNATPCYGPIEADHAGERVGHRAPDSTCGPLCHGHHMERHDFAGTFKAFTRDAMRGFRGALVQWTQNRARIAGVEIPSC